MSLVVDVDCHFDVQMTPEIHPFASRLQDVPATDEFIADCLVGDLVRHLPDRSRFAALAFVPFLPPENTSSAQQATSPGRFEPQFPLQSPDERVDWLDRVGIDRACFNPGTYAFL